MNLYRSKAAVAPLFLAATSPQAKVGGTPPTDIDLKAAYCLQALQSIVAEAADERAWIQRADVPEDVRAVGIERAKAGVEQSRFSLNRTRRCLTSRLP